jgi:protein-S-isoprenylcysteine O-methyltransferase Ste14
MTTVVPTHVGAARLSAELPDRPRGAEQQLAVAAVAAQVALLTAQALLRRRHDWPTPAAVKLGAGMVALVGAAVLAAAGSSLGRGLTASPLPNAHAELRTDGLYRHVRHPIYAGVIAISSARTATSGDRRQAALTAALMLLFYAKSTLEERALARRFSGYPSYAAGTPRFLPRVSAR